MNARRQVRFLSREFPFSRQVLLGVIALVVFLAGLLWMPESSAQGQSPTATPTPVVTAAEPSQPSPTPFPDEYAGNSAQTVGITFAGTVLVLIVVISVIVFLPQRTDNGDNA